MASPSIAIAATDASGAPAAAAAGALSSFIAKRAKAVHKKLQRISAYESQDKASLNADQIRALATKPTLDAVYNELNAVLAQVQHHEASARSDADEEIARLTDLANANAARADETKAQLSFLLLFLHLYSLFNRDSTLNPSAPAPDVPAALAATITSADIHALSPVLYAFANAPLFDATSDDSATALGIIKRIQADDPNEIIFSAGAESPAPSSAEVATGITHARIAELVRSLTALPPAPTQFGAVSFGENDQADLAGGPSSSFQGTAFGDNAYPMPVPHPADGDSIGASGGVDFGSSALPPSAGGPILFMQASEVEGETEFEPAQPSDVPSFGAVGDAPISMPIAEPAATIEPEGGAVDGAPDAQAVPAPQPDATYTEPVPPVLHDLEVAPEPEPEAPAVEQEAEPALAPGVPVEAPAASKKIDWASLDDDDDEAINEEVMRSAILARPTEHGDGATVDAPAPAAAQGSQPVPVPAAAEAEADRLVKQVDKVRANGSTKPAQPSSSSAGKSNSETNKAGGRPQGGNRAPSASNTAPPVPPRKPEPVVDEDGFVMHTTKKTIRQQQLAAQQEAQQRGGGGRGGRGGSGAGGSGARSGRGNGTLGGQAGGGRRERREGSGASAGAGGPGEGVAAGGEGAALNGHGRERSGGTGGAGPRSGSGAGGAGRGAGPGAGGQGSNAGGSGGRGRGRGRPSNSGGRPSNNPAAAGPAPAAS
ncbi:hypothetical protein V8E36_004625 [Tilletia maclaganii]